MINVEVLAVEAPHCQSFHRSSHSIAHVTHSTTCSFGAWRATLTTSVGTRHQVPMLVGMVSNVLTKSTWTQIHTRLLGFTGSTFGKRPPERDHTPVVAPSPGPTGGHLHPTHLVSASPGTLAATSSSPAGHIGFLAGGDVSHHARPPLHDVEAGSRNRSSQGYATEAAAGPCLPARPHHLHHSRSRRASWWTLLSACLCSRCRALGRARHIRPSDPSVKAAA